MAKNKGLRLVSKADRENADKVVSFKAWQEVRYLMESLPYNIPFQLSVAEAFPAFTEEDLFNQSMIYPDVDKGSG